MLMTRIIEWPEGTRLTGMSGSPQGSGRGLDGVALLHLIDLPEGQQGNVEESMAHGLLPFAGTSIHGVYPDGSEWMVMAQVGIVDEAGGFASHGSAAETFRAHLERYLQVNPSATVVSEALLHRFAMVSAYQESGVPIVDVADWSVEELLAGMVCEMCGVDLVDVVAGRDSGCSFPDMDHFCTGDGFTDVFAQWARGLLNVAAYPDREEVNFDQDEEDDADDADDDSSLDDETQSEPLRSLSLASSHQLGGGDWALRAAWIETRWLIPPRAERKYDRRSAWISDALHIARCDYGDDGETTWGVDVDDPGALLSWLVQDEFGGRARDLDEFVKDLGLERGEWVFVGHDADVPPNLSTVAGPGESVFVRRRMPRGVEVCVINDGPALLLALLRNRFDGSEDLDAAITLLDEAGCGWTRRDRGYI